MFSICLDDLPTINPAIKLIAITEQIASKCHNKNVILFLLVVPFLYGDEDMPSGVPLLIFPCIALLQVQFQTLLQPLRHEF
jgi:hypothetical protein